MNLDGVRDFFRARLDGLSYKEWEDGFNSKNIPATLLDKSYHLDIGKIVSKAANQRHHTFLYPLAVRVFLKGFRNPSEAIDQGLAEADTIMADLLNPINRLQSDGLKDIRPLAVEVTPISESNDNAVVINMEFESVLMFVF